MVRGNEKLSVFDAKVLLVQILPMGKAQVTEMRVRQTFHKCLDAILFVRGSKQSISIPTELLSRGILVGT